MRQQIALFYTSYSISFIYFPTQYDVNFPNLFLRIFNHLENQYVVPYLGTRETKEKHDVCQNVCHHFDFAYNTLLWPYKSRIYASGKKRNNHKCYRVQRKQSETT